MLTDFGLGVARDYGLTFRMSDELEELYVNTLRIDLVRFNGDESWELPVPATFVIEPEGTIVYAAADPDYTLRPEPEEVLAAVP